MRRGLHSGAARWPWFRRVVRIGARELDRALRDDVYEGDYYDRDQPPAAPLEIGSADYTRRSTHADVGAYLIWRWFPASHTLDVGCAFGFFVEAQRELGIDAEGIDVSQHALDHAALGARGHVRYGNLLHRVPFRTGAFDLVSAFETLEHLPPDLVPKALLELRRLTAKYLIATIPSFGPNAFGPGGWYEAKVRPDRLDDYRARGDEYMGPVPYEDLARDASGRPVEGHLTVASFAWWTQRFAEAGFVRCGAVERRMHPHLARFGLTKYWNLYVFRVANVAEPADGLRDAEQIAAVEQRARLAEFLADPEDVARVKVVLGDDSFDGVPLTYANG